MVDISNPQIAGLSGNWLTGSIGGGPFPIRAGSGGGGGGGTGLMNITIGNNAGLFVGYSKGFFGATDNEKPNPPIPPAAAICIVNRITQNLGLGWTINMDCGVVPPSGPAQNVWTSLTLTGGAGPIVLFSASATYALQPAAPNDTGAEWSFGATADVWFSLGDGTMVTATFA